MIEEEISFILKKNSDKQIRINGIDVHSMEINSDIININNNEISIPANIKIKHCNEGNNIISCYFNDENGKEYYILISNLLYSEPFSRMDIKKDIGTWEVGNVF